MNFVQIKHHYELLIVFGICLTASPPSNLLNQNSPPKPHISQFK
jgi:hypothetical protein